MKITGEDVMFRSENHAQQRDLTLENTAQKRIVRQRSGTQRIDPEAPGVIVDRVSLSKKQTAAFQSGYGAKIAVKSMVTSPRDSEAVLHEQTQVVEKLVGGIIDKKAVMRKMTAGKDVVLDSVDMQPEGAADPAGRSFLPSFSSVSSVTSLSIFSSSRCTAGPLILSIKWSAFSITPSLPTSINCSFLLSICIFNSG